MSTLKAAAGSTGARQSSRWGLVQMEDGAAKPALGNVFMAAIRTGSRLAPGNDHISPQTPLHASRQEAATQSNGEAKKHKGLLQQVLMLRKQSSGTLEPSPAPVLPSEPESTSIKSKLTTQPCTPGAAPPAGPNLLKAVLKLRQSAPGEGQAATDTPDSNCVVLSDANIVASEEPHASSHASSALMDAFKGMITSTDVQPRQHAGTTGREAKALSASDKLKRTMRAQKAARFAQKRKEAMISAETRVQPLLILCRLTALFACSFER